MRKLKNRSEAIVLSIIERILREDYPGAVVDAIKPIKITNGSDFDTVIRVTGYWYRPISYRVISRGSSVKFTAVAQ